MGVRGLHCFFPWSQRMGLLCRVRGPLAAVASRVAHRLSGLTLVGSSRTRGRVRVPCTPVHCTTREVLK